MRICKKYQAAIAAIALLLPAAGAGPLASPQAQPLLENLLRERLKLAGAREVRLQLTLVPGHSTGRPCPQALQVKLPERPLLTRFKASIVCPATPAWRNDYIVRADASALVVQAVRDIDAGTPLAAADLHLARQPIIQIDDYVYRIDAAQGLSSRKALKTGQALRRKTLEAAVLVKRGKRVEIVARKAQVEVRASAEALAHGRLGEEVRVRNLATGKVIRARVSGEEEVEPIE